MIELSKGNIKLLIEEPTEGYCGSRFDLSGKVIQLYWKDISFCASEVLGDKTGQVGRGFFNEFGITDPVGYDECKVGAYFPKIGVGMLKKEKDEAYNFFHNYKQKRFDFSIVEKGDTVIIDCLNKDLNTAFFLEKRISVNEDGFSIDYMLENIGNKVIKTSEYTHNFLSIGHYPLYSNHKLSIGLEINKHRFEQGINPDNCVDFSGNTINWNKIPNSDFFFDEIAKPIAKQENWKLSNEKLKLEIAEYIDFEPSKINLWGKGHVVSPEVFKAINIQPGETDTWRREYRLTGIN